MATEAGTPKAATMTTRAAVLAASEDSAGMHTWCNPARGMPACSSNSRSGG